MNIFFALSFKEFRLVCCFFLLVLSQGLNTLDLHRQTHVNAHVTPTHLTCLDYNINKVNHIHKYTNTFAHATHIFIHLYSTFNVKYGKGFRLCLSVRECVCACVIIAEADIRDICHIMLWCRW